MKNGLAVIVTNDYKNTLKGTEIDGRNLERAFKGINFSVLRKHNISRAELLEQCIRKMNRAKEMNNHYRCMIFIFSGHGFFDHIVANDSKKIHIYDDIITPLLPKKEKAIATIPKVFLIDACRGSKKTMTITLPPFQKQPKHAAIGGGGEAIQVAAEGGYTVAYPTLPEHVTYNDSYKGSTWLRTLAELIEQGRYLYSLADLLTHVNEVMQKKMDKSNFVQPSFTWRINQIVNLDPSGKVTNQ